MGSFCERFGLCLFLCISFCALAFFISDHARQHFVDNDCERRMGFKVPEHTDETLEREYFHNEIKTTINNTICDMLVKSQMSRNIADNSFFFVGVIIRFTNHYWLVQHICWM